MVWQVAGDQEQSPSSHPAGRSIPTRATWCQGPEEGATRHQGGLPGGRSISLNLQGQGGRLLQQLRVEGSLFNVTAPPCVWKEPPPTHEQTVETPPMALASCDVGAWTKGEPQTPVLPRAPSFPLSVTETAGPTCGNSGAFRESRAVCNSERAQIESQSWVQIPHLQHASRVMLAQQPRPQPFLAEAQRPCL